jgi:tRNA-modifying protein YgfZ
MARSLISVAGPDRVSFLQGLVTVDVRKLEQARILYGAMLTPQGKYLADFFLVDQDDHILLDVDSMLADDLELRLQRYRLRAQVSLSRSDLAVSRGTGAAPAGALADPRDPRLGWRFYGAPMPETATDWDALRVDLCIPEAGIELIPNDSYILEHGFERMGGVDFRKGCYVGQEVTARMHHKTELKKGLARVALDGPVAIGTPILADGKEAGTVLTQSGGQAIAYLRFDRAQPQMQAGDVIVTWDADIV